MYYTLHFSIERYLSCLLNPDVLIGNFRSREKIQKVIENKTNDKKRRTPIEKFYHLIWKVKLIIRMKKIKRGEGLITPTRNPLMKKLYLTLFLWFFVCALVYFIIPYAGTKDTRVTGLQKLLCNDYYIEPDTLFQHNQCHTLWKGKFYYQLFLLLNLAYVYFSALQIRCGFNQMRESIISKDWTNTIGYANFKTYEAVPLLREINTTIEFSAANTSLSYLEWIKMEDIRGAMLQAKYQAERRLIKIVGDAINGLVKVCIGITALVIVVLIIVSPLLLFSDLNPGSTVDQVERAKMSVDLIFDKKGNFSLLSDLHMVATKPSPNNRQMLDFSNIMENSMPFTPESITNLADLLKNANGVNSNIFLRIILELKVGGGV